MSKARLVASRNADRLDSQDGVFYLDYNNFINTPNILDSADVAAIGGVDSAAIINLIDSDYVSARVASTVVTNIVDSDYINFRVDAVGGGGATEVTINQAGHGFSVLDAIRSDSSGFVLAQADDAGTLAQGVVIEVIDTDNFKYAITGRYNIAHGKQNQQWFFLSDSVAGGTEVESPVYSQPLIFTEDSNYVSIFSYRPTSVGEDQYPSIVESDGFVYIDAAVRLKHAHGGSTRLVFENQDSNDEQYIMNIDYNVEGLRFFRENFDGGGGVILGVMSDSGDLVLGGNGPAGKKNVTYRGLELRSQHASAGGAIRLSSGSNEFADIFSYAGILFFEADSDKYITMRIPANDEVLRVTKDGMLINKTVFNSTGEDLRALQVSGEVVVEGASTQLRCIDPSGNYGLMLRNDGNSTYFLLTDSAGSPYDNWNGLRPIRITNVSGNVSMANFQIHALHETGTLQCVTLTETSDESFKTEIETIEDAWNLVRQMRGTRHLKNGLPSAGVIAQEQNNVTPELVTVLENGKLGVNYGGISAYFIEAFKEVHDAYQEQELRLKALEEAVFGG